MTSVCDSIRSIGHTRYTVSWEYGQASMLLPDDCSPSRIIREYCKVTDSDRRFLWLESDGETITIFKNDLALAELQPDY